MIHRALRSTERILLLSSSGTISGLLRGDAIADDAQAFFGTGGHRQGEWLAVHTEVADRAFAAHMGDFDLVGGEELDHFLIAGVTTHEF